MKRSNAWFWGLVVVLASIIALARLVPTHPVANLDVRATANSGDGLPGPGSYVAYSLSAAKHHLELGEIAPGLAGLGGITCVAGMVYDPASRDLVLVGQNVPGQPKLALEDLVVALRALMLHKQYPLVSIDRTPETRKTGLQTLRWEGGIQDTLLGASLANADVKLKSIVLGQITEDWGGLSYFKRVEADTAARAETERVGTLFWFYARDPVVKERHGVFSISRLDVGVKTEVISYNGQPVHNTEVHDRVGEQFAADLSGRYARVSSISSDVARLRGLFALVAVASGVRSLAPNMDLDYWLRDYQIARIVTPRVYPLITRHSSISTRGRQITVEVNGGIQLRALLLRLQDGDVTALRDVVLRTRPGPNALVWRIPLREWRIPGSNITSPATDENADRALASKMGTSIERSILVPPLPTNLPGPGLRPPTQQGLGGVKYESNPVSAGKGGADIRDRVLQSRPGCGGLTFPVKLPETGN